MLLTVFWQWRHTVYFAQLSGSYFEHASLHIYAADVLAIVLLAGSWLAGWRVKTNLPKTVVWSCLAVLVWATISSLWAENWVAAIWRAAELWLWSGVMVWLIGSKQPLGWLLKWVIAGGVVSAVVGIFEYLKNADLGLQRFGESPLKAETLGVPVIVDNGVRQLRAHGLTPHPNILGGVLGMAIASWVVWYESVKSRLGWQLVVPLILLVGLVWSFSRGPVLAMIVCFVLAAWAIFKVSGLGSRWMVVTLGAMLMGLILWQSGLWVGRINPQHFDSLEERSVSERLLSVGQWREMVSDNWVVGVGLANYPMELAKQIPEALAWEIQPVHNAALLWAAEVGIVGLILLFWFVWEAARYLRMRYLKHGTRVILFGLPLLIWIIVGLVDYWPVGLHQGYVGLFLALALLFWQDDV
jgi:hypothetical protein